MTGDAENGATMVLGLGNLLLGDEGFGIHVVRCLRDVKLPGNVRKVEGGGGGFYLLGLLEGAKPLLFYVVKFVDSPLVKFDVQYHTTEGSGK